MVLGQGWKLGDQFRYHCHDTGKMTVAGARVVAIEVERSGRILDLL